MDGSLDYLANHNIHRSTFVMMLWSGSNAVSIHVKNTQLCHTSHTAPICGTIYRWNVFIAIITIFHHCPTKTVPIIYDTSYGPSWGAAITRTISHGLVSMRPYPTQLVTLRPSHLTRLDPRVSGGSGHDQWKPPHFFPARLST